jgi:hypothetical protein
LPDKFPPERQREALLSLQSAIGTAPRALRRDGCGDPRIEGKHGHVYAVCGLAGAKPPKAGFQMFVLDWTARGWKAAKDVLPGVVCNDGDDEGAMFLDRLPTPTEAGAIRKWLGLPKRVEYSEPELERRRKAMARAREVIQPLAA